MAAGRYRKILNFQHIKRLLEACFEQDRFGYVIDGDVGGEMALEGAGMGVAMEDCFYLAADEGIGEAGGP